MFLNESDKYFNYFLFKRNIEIKIISFFPIHRIYLIQIYANN